MGGPARAVHLVTPAAGVAVGIVGLRHGARHAEAMHALGSARLVALCDPDETVLHRVGERLGVPAGSRFTDVRAMVAGGAPDAVVISVPNHLHAAVAEVALRHGLHVLLDKPLAGTLADGRRIVAAAAEAGVRLAVLHEFRADRYGQTLRRLVLDGAVGRAYQSRVAWHRRSGVPGPPKFGGWYRQRELSGGGPLLDLGVHRLDQLLWVLGSPRVRSVSAATFDCHVAGDPGIAVEDTALGFLRLEDGSVVFLETSFVCPGRRAEEVLLEIRGGSGSLTLENEDDSYRDYRLARMGPVPGGGFADVPVTLAAARSPYADFVDAVLTGGPALCDGTEALSVLGVIDALYRSAAAGHELPVPGGVS